MVMHKFTCTFVPWHGTEQSYENLGLSLLFMFIGSAYAYLDIYEMVIDDIVFIRVSQKDLTV